MDVRIRERLVGALVLVALIVFLVPALLKGPGIASGERKAADTKSVEIMLDGAAGPAESEGLVPEPEIAQGKAQATSPVLPKTVEAVPPPRDTATAEPQATARPPKTGPALAAPSVQPAWAVQLGAFSSRSKADRLVAELRSRGYSAFVLEYRAGGQLLHRVRVGPEQDRARAVAVAERLRKDGFQTVVAPHP
jgi:DedD protein